MRVEANPFEEAPRPQALSVIAEHIPEELKALNHWVNWTYEFRSGKWTKPPRQADGVTPAKSTDPFTWYSFPDAVRCYGQGDIDGIGFVLAPETGIVGVDLDHCRNRETGKVDQWAREIVARLDSYTELSPSGEGIHVFVKGLLPAGGRKKGNVEAYSSGRYLTVTGQHLEGCPATIEPRQDQVDYLLREVFSDPPKMTLNQNGNGSVPPRLSDDDEILTKALNAKNKEKFGRLFDGDFSDYPSQSEADLGLCDLFAFWTRDSSQIDRLFRQSALYREKWDSPRGGSTYGRDTIETALASHGERYTPALPRADNTTGEESTTKKTDPPTSPDIDTGPYGVEDGCITRLKQTQQGPICEPLCNFNAWVDLEVVLDDGAEPVRAFVLEGELQGGAKLPPLRVPASRFSSMNWVTESWGLRAVVRAGQGSRDYLREAIQRLSPKPRVRHIFTHTGWREIDGQWVYLSGNTYGSDGFEVDLGSELSRYKLPSIAENPVEAMKVSLSLLKLAPLRVTAPLWASTYRAPTVCAFPQDSSPWIEGLTGSLKTTLVALFLSHYGDFDRTHLPGAWSSTANQLERRAFLLKDSLFVIDDYAPSALDHREMETKASRLLRAQGNLAGRGRLRADLSERPAFVPRGIIISTGEQHPPGQSLLARTLVIEMDRAEVDIDALTEAQKQSGRLPHAMAGYIEWLKPQMGHMPKLLRETFQGARRRATTVGGHLRIPEAAAHLWLGLHCGLSYAEDIGALSATEATGLQEKCWEAFLEIGRGQAQVVEEEKPTRRFLAVLSNLITQGRGLLLSKDEIITSTEPKPGVDFLGWKDDESLYLLSEPAFAAVARFCRDTGEPFPIRQERLRRDLFREGFSECDPNRFTKMAKIGGRGVRVLKLSAQRINTLLEDEAT